MSTVTRTRAAASKSVVKTLLVILLSVSLTEAQESLDSVFRSDVPLVLAPVTVTDKKGNSIDGLTADDFRLTDDGQPRKIRVDTSDTVAAPVSLVVLIQSSGISAPQLARISQVGGMIKPIVAGDRGQVATLTFDREVRLIQEFTADATRVRASFEHLRSIGIRSGVMLDAVAEGVKMLELRPYGNRRVMLILGESRDRGSKTTLGAVMEQAQRSGVVIYSGTYSVQAATFVSRPEDAPSMPGDADYIAGIGELIRLGKTNTTDALARATGGRHLSFLKTSSLENTISQVGAEIHSQYLLSFAPSSSINNNKNTGFHQIQVAVPSRPDAVIRVRPGYWAGKAN